jgi:electron transfer flavoprotein beta subunit
MSEHSVSSIVVCLKWVYSPIEPGDDRFATLSAADEAALECALRHGEITGLPVHAITVGGPAAERAMRIALACGTGSATHVLSTGESGSDDVAAHIASCVGGATWVWCGDYSLDRGTGSVPAFLAARLATPQALGLVEVDIGANGVSATRRIDGGRREQLHVGRGVLSVEGSVASLRRAGLAATLAAASAPITTVRVDANPGPVASVRPYRPRARAIAAPHHPDSLERLRQLTDAAAAPARGELVTLEPEAAAGRILDQLAAWGYR